MWSHLRPCVHLSPATTIIFNCIVIPTKWIYFSKIRTYAAPLSSGLAISSDLTYFQGNSVCNTIVSPRVTRPSHNTKSVGYIWHCRNQQMLQVARGGSMRHHYWLWSPYVIGQTIIFSSGFFLLLSSSFFFFPRLISAVGEWMFSILRHMLWP